MTQQPAFLFLWLRDGGRVRLLMPTERDLGSGSFTQAQMESNGLICLPIS